MSLTLEKEKIMKKYILFFLAGILMTSCIDTEVLPNDVTIGEDFWQDADDVQYMVDGAYSGLTEIDVIERMIVWGGFRGDELNALSDATVDNDTKTDLTYIKQGYMDYTNMYADWSAFYTVINRCNQVIERAPAVVEIDPAYTKGTLNVHLSQMKALRALCYFYLMRAFRDIPITPGAYFEDSQVDEIAQSAPKAVLDTLEKDLLEALETPLAATGYTDWRKVGYLNIEGIASILADVYLWRASMTHSAADYQNCITYCDLVIDSKNDNYVEEDMGPNATEKAWDNLIYDAESAYEEIFVNGNSDESIFEIQFSSSVPNWGLQYLYWSWDSDHSSYTNHTYGYMMASTIFGEELGGDNWVFADAGGYDGSYDARYYTSVYDGDDDDVTEFWPLKMCHYTGFNASTYNRFDNVTGTYSHTRRGLTASESVQNWIVYRLSDIMLMKAEALVQLCSDSSDTATTDDDDDEETDEDEDEDESSTLSSSDESYLRQAFALVNEVNKRSMLISTITATDTLLFSSYSSKSDMELLVLEERLRELCFEGKRYFDLMRYNYRHVDADITTILADQGTEAKSMLTNYSNMMTLMTRGMSSGITTAKAKMPTEPYLYFPIYEDELEVNTLLKQNPAYEADDTYVKNN